MTPEELKGYEMWAMELQFLNWRVETMLMLSSMEDDFWRSLSGRGGWDLLRQISREKAAVERMAGLTPLGGLPL